MVEGHSVSGDVKPWGIFATFAFGAIALLVGQFSGIAAVSGLYGFNLKQIGTISRDGGAIILFICVSAPVQVALLVAAAGYKGNAAAYLGYKLPRRNEVLFGIAALAALIGATAFTGPTIVVDTRQCRSAPTTSSSEIHDTY